MSGDRLNAHKFPSEPLPTMKKIALFILAAAAVMTVLSKLPTTAQARTVILPTPTPGPVVSAR